MTSLFNNNNDNLFLMTPLLPLPVCVINSECDAIIELVIFILLCPVIKQQVGGGQSIGSIQWGQK